MSSSAQDQQRGRPDLKDPQVCQAPYCNLPINGHDWLLLPLPGGTFDRFGFCSQYHAELASDLGRDVAHRLVLESDPADNEEDRMRPDRPKGGSGSGGD